MDDVKLNTFPSTECEALAMLYVQSQDLSNVSPEGLLDMYRDAYKRIREHRKELNKREPKSWAF